MKKKPLRLLLLASMLIPLIATACMADKKQVTANPVMLKDVDKNASCYQSVLWAVENSIMDADKGNFNPNGIVTREDIISALYQYAKHTGVDVSSGENTNILSYTDSTDIAEGKHSAFQWACHLGLIGKNGETKLKPKTEVTNQDMIKLLYDYSVIMKKDVSIGKDTNILSFEDADKISEGNFEAFQWACGTGIIGGTNATKLEPLSKVTRSKLTEVLMSYDKLSFSGASGNKDRKYDIVKEFYSKNKITIHYPKITNLRDTEAQDKINEIIKTDALKQLKDYKDWAAALDKPYEEAIEATIDYEVKFKGANFLSIAYSGYSTLNNDRSERNYHTLNLDLNTGKILGLKDFVNINQSFIDKFITRKFQSKNSLYPESNKSITDELYQSLDFLYKINSKPDYKGLKQYFDETDALKSDSIDTSCNFSYVTDHSLGITVMVSHASGNYAEFEINLAEVKENLRGDNVIWKDFSGLFP